ncbi:hypothetical protein SDC9_134133 [bioreactor metagenome]|uniref:Uncharacterized protein n=1 Tax=bioreactor metagenome TaxID=1076179 RepID=A0A645DC29_9ZZZZ
MGRIVINLGKDLAQFHTTLAKLLAVQVYRRHRHDLALLDLGLKQRAVDHRVTDIGVENGQQVQRLHHVRAVVARQGDIGLEIELAFEALDLLDHIGLDLGWIARGLQQRKDQRGKFMPHRQAGKTHAPFAPLGRHRERGLALIVVATLDQGDQAGLLGNIAQQFLHFMGFCAIVQRRHDLDRLRHPLQVGFQLSLDIGVQHDDFLLSIEGLPMFSAGQIRHSRRLAGCRACCRGTTEPRRKGAKLRSCRRGRWTEPESSRRPSTWPGRLRSGEPRRTGQP